MNKRIAALANQSGFDVDDSGKFGNYSEMYRLEKFAELIILDVVEYYRSQIGETSEPHTAILEHFGVE